MKRRDGKTFQEFSAAVQCSLPDALNIIRKASGKKHVFIALDELNRIKSDSSSGTDDLLYFMAKITPSLDHIGTEERTNFICSSLASIPLRILETASGRKFKASSLLFRIFDGFL